MPKPSFVEKLTAAMGRADSLLCIGLDPDPHKFSPHFSSTLDPAAALLRWGQSLIEQTADLTCCYKPNIAFYEQYGPAGLEALRQTIAAVPAEMPVLLDAKRGDIDSTAAAYARAAFEIFKADAITISPYLGCDSLTPFLTYPGKMIFALCYTSNPSAAEVQEFGHDDERLFERVVRLGQSWGDASQVGFVVGATQPQALARVRVLAPERWILAPGIGAQGGDLAAALAAGLNRAGSGLIVPVSRSVIYADNPRAAALALRDQINQTRQTLRSSLHPSSFSPHPFTDLILQLYEAGCVQFGQFTLASGLFSPIYIDLRRLTASPALLRQVARAYADLLRPLSYDRLAAVPYAALPVSAAVALAVNRPLIYPRKEVKAYGMGQAIEGVFAAGERVAVIEDLITTGGSILKAAETLEAAGLSIADVAVLIDREQGGAAALAEKGYRLHAVLTLAEILATLQAAGRISATQRAEVEAYLRG